MPSPVNQNIYILSFSITNIRKMTSTIRSNLGIPNDPRRPNLENSTPPMIGPQNMPYVKQSDAHAIYLPILCLSAVSAFKDIPMTPTTAPEGP